jgi:hypothetical protein
MEFTQIDELRFGLRLIFEQIFEARIPIDVASLVSRFGVNRL